MEISPVVFWYAAALVAGIYSSAGFPGLPAALLSACALLASALGHRRLGRLALCAASFAAGGALRASGAAATAAPPPEGGVFDCEVETVSPSGAWVSAGGARVWLSGARFAAAAMEGDSATVLSAERGGVLSCWCFAIRPPAGPLDRARRTAAAALRSRVPSRQASSLACALLLGERSGMPASVRAAFREAGISHMLSVSGFHVALVAGAVFLALQRAAGRSWGSAAGAILIAWLYVLLTGGRAPAVRAGIMGTVAMASSRAGVRVPALSSWSLAAVAVCLTVPGAVRDPGARMSFVSVLSLVLMTSRSRGGAGAVLGVLHAGFCATLAVAPLVQSSYGAVRLSSPHATLLSTPPMYLVMALGALCLVPGACIPASRLLEWVSWGWLALAALVDLPPVRISGTPGWCAWAAAMLLLWLSGRRRGFPARFLPARPFRGRRAPPGRT